MTRGSPLVLHVIHHLVIGGMENGLVNLINRMPPSRFRHAIACIEDYSDFRNRITRDDVEVLALNRSRVGLWAVRRELFSLCRRLRPAIVHSRGMSGLDALLPTRLAGTKHHVHGEHGWDVHDLDGTARKPVLLRRLHAPLIDRYVTVSKHLERYLIDRVRVAPSRITQIYNGVDTERFVPARENPRAILPAGFADSESVIVGTVGRVQPVKDHATLARSFAALARLPIGERLRLVIVGGGPLLDELRQLVADLGIEKKTWLPGPLADVPSVMKTFDVFVLSSLSEGISNTILEAMACGIPVAATRVGGNVELVEEGRTGELFEPRDTTTLARLIERYAQDPAHRSAQAALARRRAVEVFGLATMVERYQSVYEGIVADKR